MNYVAYAGVHSVNEEGVRSAIADLHDKDGLVRRRARRSLVELGDRAVSALVGQLRSPNDNVRWEAAKALGELHAPEAAPALVERLQDDNFSIRWLAAEALVGLGESAVAPILRALMRHPDSVWLRQGAHHVLRSFSHYRQGSVVQPVVKALEEMEPILGVPIAAGKALTELAGAT
jgi:HEAT repeat protein